MAVALVLLHSPLVGPGTWRALAPELGAVGFEVRVPDYSAEMALGPPYYERLVRVARDSLAGSGADGTILVAHSGAGALIPAIAGGGLANAAIFMDALLPHPGRSWFATAPDALKRRLAELARDGRVPPWHRWWQKGAVESLFREPAEYERFTSALNDLPLAYFSEPAPAIEMPDRFACAYLQLSAGCEAEAALAETCGWPVRRAPLHHLAMLTHPAEVALQLKSLVQALTSRPAA